MAVAHPASCWPSMGRDMGVCDLQGVQQQLPLYTLDCPPGGSAHQCPSVCIWDRVHTHHPARDAHYCRTLPLGPCQSTCCVQHMSYIMQLHIKHLTFHPVSHSRADQGCVVKCTWMQMLRTLCVLCRCCVQQVHPEQCRQHRLHHPLLCGGALPVRVPGTRLIQRHRRSGLLHAGAGLTYHTYSALPVRLAESFCAGASWECFPQSAPELCDRPSLQCRSVFDLHSMAVQKSWQQQHAARRSRHAWLTTHAVCCLA